MLSGLASMMVTRVATIAAGAAGLAHVASLDDAAAMFGNFWIEKLAAQRFEVRACLPRPPPSAANTPPHPRRGLLPADVQRISPLCLPVLICILTGIIRCVE
jgi:hypothetical protein